MFLEGTKDFIIIGSSKLIREQYIKLGKNLLHQFSVKKSVLYQGKLQRKVTITCTLFSELH